jgi:ADP-ribosylation factor family
MFLSFCLSFFLTFYLVSESFLFNGVGCELQNELFSLLDHEHLQNAAILVFANKQDLKDAMAVGDLTQTLNLHSIKKHDWHIQVGTNLLQQPRWNPQNAAVPNLAHTAETLKMLLFLTWLFLFGDYCCTGLCTPFLLSAPLGDILKVLFGMYNVPLGALSWS